MDALKDYGAFGLAVLLAGGSVAAPANLQLPLLLIGALVASVGFALRGARMGIGAGAFLAFGCASYLFAQKLKTTEGPSLCNINEVFNCDVVNGSEASELFGVPVALLGMGAYLGIGIASLLKAEATPRLFAFAFWINVINTLFSIYLGMESAKLGAVCVMCLTMYTSHLVMLGAAVKGLREAGESVTDGLGQLLTSTSTLITAASFGIVVLVGMSSWNTASARKPGLTPRPDPHTADAGGHDATGGVPAGIVTTPRGPVGLAGHEPILGNPQAPYLVLEFADFACPHCAMAAKEVKQLVQMYPEIQVRFRPFPLTSQCNPAMQRDSGPERCQAAIAGKCAGRQGKFWDMSSLMFANQQNLTDPDLQFMAGQIGLDVAAWEQCMGDPVVRAEVEADAVAGAQAGIMGTPTFFLLGAYGDQWVEVQGVGGIAAVVNAHQAGQALPVPGPPTDLH
jgi:protein-disulfide isomerase/uncharacterized membrane protein